MGECNMFITIHIVLQFNTNIHLHLKVVLYIKLSYE